ncbi:ATP-binding protein [Desulfothermus okinawensis JCM 13304]
MGKNFDTLPKNAKCTRCKKQAIIRLPSHNAKFCKECFEHFFKTAVIRAMKKIKIQKDTPIMVAVSGGKDSLVLWDVLNELGYKTMGIHIDLGIDEFSKKSIKAIENFAGPRDLEWKIYHLTDFVGLDMVQIHKKIRRKICSVCGKLKRQLLDVVTTKEGFSVVATGHNLDDEAGRLLGNLIGKREEYVKKTYPYLPSPHPKIPAKIKPLYRLEIKEILIYAQLKSIEPVNIDCPLSRGATSRKFKKALNLLENQMPGIKRNFLFRYIEQNRPMTGFENYRECKICGYPTYLDLCNLCNIKKQLKA